MTQEGDGLYNFSWVRQGRLAGMAWPDPEAWQTLADLGIRAVLTLTEARPPGDPRAAGLAWRHLPIEDFGVPDVEALEEAVHWIHGKLKAGLPVVVHCRAGIGRTGLVLAATLADDGLSAAQARAAVRAVRPGSIETPAQMRLLEHFVHRAQHRTRKSP